MTGASTPGQREEGHSIERLAAVIPGGNAGLVAAVFLGLYLSFTILGVVLGLSLGGLVNTLQSITFFAAVYALLALALNLQWGYAGLFNVGIVGFMAIGVYTMAILTRPVNPATGTPGLGLPLMVGVLGGVIAAALFGLLTAIPALRVSDDYLAIITVGLAEIVRIAANSSALERVSIAGTVVGTGGASGLALPVNPVGGLYYIDPASRAAGPTAIGTVVFGTFEPLGIHEAIIVDWTYTVFLLGMVVLFYLLLERTGRSPFGRVLKAIREDELVANALGKDVNRFKVKTFSLGCALMGLAGILWQGSQGFTSPTNFLPQQTFYIFIALIIGGAGSNTGSILGGALFAGVLFQGPPLLARIVSRFVDFGRSPTTILDALVPLAALDPGPLFAFALDNVANLRFMLVGVVLVYLIQRKPQGLLGHRSEVAASASLSRPDGDGSGITDEDEGIPDG